MPHVIPSTFQSVGIDLHSRGDVSQDVFDADVDGRDARYGIEVCAEPVQLIDASGRLCCINARAREAFEIDAPLTVLWHDWITLWPKSVRPAAKAALEIALGGAPARFSGRCPTARKNERYWEVVVSPYTDPSDGSRLAVAILRDVTADHAALDRFRWGATHDALTGLANRAWFDERLQQQVAEASIGGKRLLLAVFDVDKFKQINDRFGHGGGDEVLRTLGKRLEKLLPRGCLRARLGGDEFAVAMTFPDDADAEAIVRAFIARLCKPHRYQGNILEWSVSCGLAVFPDHSSTMEELVSNADTALYAGKAAGRGRIVCFNAQIQNAVQLESSMLSLAERALAKGWIRPHYQPKVDLRTGKICGFEALLRWRMPGGSMQAPATIAAAFSDSALSPKVLGLMLAKVLADLKRWSDRGIRLPVAINVSDLDLRQLDLAKYLLERVERAGVPYELLDIEVTESVFLGQGAEHAGKVLAQLSAAGVRIALDDFGTGYASLSNLKSFPIDVIKIDQSFVRNLVTDPDDRAIVATMITLGRSLSMEVVAEGIENHQHLDFLRGAGCDVGQGYLFGEAMPAARIPGLTNFA